MGFIKGIITGAKTLLGVSKDGSSNVMKVASGIGGWIDEQKFTEEEKAKYAAETAEQFQRFFAETIKENTERSRTRRDIATWIIRSWFVMLFISIVAYGVELTADTPVHDFSTYVLQVATIGELLYLVLGVGGFFFGAHIIRQTKYSSQ